MHTGASTCHVAAKENPVSRRDREEKNSPPGVRLFHAARSRRRKEEHDLHRWHINRQLVETTPKNGKKRAPSVSLTS